MRTPIGYVKEVRKTDSDPWVQEGDVIEPGKHWGARAEMIQSRQETGRKLVRVRPLYGEE